MESDRTKDSGTLQYDWFFSDDQSECVVHERYRNSEALLEHTANLGETMDAIFATSSVSGEILGTPSPELMKASRVAMCGSILRTSRYNSHT